MLFGACFHTRTKYGAIIVSLLLIVFARRLVIAEKVFHGVENMLSLLTTKNQATCMATDAYKKQNDKLSHNLRNIYPLDLFGEDSSDDCHPCFFQPTKLHQEAHSCSSSRFVCPVKEEYIPITMAGFENASSQVCHSLRALEEQERVNVIIVGGSVTLGHIADGCMEGTCIELNSNGFCLNVTGYECAWHRSVVKYLSHRYKNADLNVINLSKGATTSCTLPHLLAQKLETDNITLTSRDLVLYDYSVNDGVSFSNPTGLHKLRHCVEASLERLAQYSQNGIPPAVILLDYFPYKGLDLKAEYPEPISSANVYREVASQFRLPVISYRDLFWHKLFREDLKPFPKLEYILLNKWVQTTNDDVHPPWMVHDVFADVIAGALELTRQLCMNEKSLIESNTQQFVSAPVRAEVVLLNEEATTTNAPYLTPEEVQRLPYGWSLYQDRPGKPGWIVEKELSGKVFDAALTFSVPDKPISVSTTSSATLQVSFMQTYKNAGAFAVVVCNNYLTTPWPDHRTTLDTLIEDHYTSLDVAVYEVDLNTVCKNESVVVKIYHILLQDRLESRANQKVKITSVRLTVPKPSPITPVTAQPEVVTPVSVLHPATSPPTLPHGQNLSSSSAGQQSRYYIAVAIFVSVAVFAGWIGQHSAFRFDHRDTVQS
jgi:hypothetical protein